LVGAARRAGPGPRFLRGPRAGAGAAGGGVEGVEERAAGEGARGAAAIVPGAGLGIHQELVRLTRRLEALLRGGVPPGDVGVALPRDLPEGPLDVVGAGVRRDAEDAVGVLGHGHPARGTSAAASLGRISAGAPARGER